MKTKDRILKYSLQLFNNEGEQNITPVDIANVLDISPGNLYYHFKGKDPIIRQLFLDFEEEFKMVLRAPIEKPLDLSDNWVYFYILFEEVADFRFFYRNLQSILERYEDLERRFRALVSLKIKTMRSLLDALNKSGFTTISAIEADQMAERFALQLTYWPTYQTLMHDTDSTPISIHNGVFGLISQLSPYVNNGSEEFLSLLVEFRDKMLRAANS
ncbi:TetR/AcrR family transcriptional regulator [Kordiimonas sp. SCSIO 12610]|uniref:TetR/AcrR family transcriptional regulator n=1 Tax=Kordiimonas sp. SCSIO 12610 TaxID=2829597 RepID=UPI00210E8B9D|nr:TetR/AcrR family transcriptional regulator [Kordiimonas sp. SCSIO 12610]UTW54789.1 TetR family transcriptional regulator [Kordiimonas sp. SCSIO 12610]